VNSVRLHFSEPLPLEPVRMTGKERLGEAATFEFELAGPADPIIAPSRLLRAPLVVEIDTEAGRRTIAGVVTRFVVRATDHPDRRAYDLTLRSRFALLELRRVPRIFRDLAVPDVIERVVREAGYARVERRIAEERPALPWVIRYEETDAAFVRRLCEEHGLYFSFEEDSGAEVFILSDTSTGAPFAYSEKIPFVSRATPSEPRPFVAEAARVRARRPGKVTLRDYDPDRPALALEGAAADGVHVERSTEVYAAPGGFRTPDEGEARARRRLEALRADASRLALRTNATALAPGFCVALAEGPDDQKRARVAGAWFVVATEARWEAVGGALSLAVEAIPRDVPYRLPCVTPRPRATGIQSAFVTGNPGQEIDPDGLGRIFVRFPWEVRGPNDRGSSVPVRVAQPEAPAGLVVPRVGWEVFVAFEEEDPERPVVLGRSYNGKHPPPLPLPANKTVTSIATDSSPGGPARTAIQLDDAAGRQHFLIQAPFAKDDKVFGDATTETKKNENAQIDANSILTVAGKEAVSVNLAWSAAYGSRDVSVAALSKHHAGGSFVTHVGGTELVAVGGMVGERVGNPVTGAANLIFSAALAGVGTRGTAGAIAAAGAGIGRAALEGFQADGKEGAAKAAGMGAAGVFASMVPGGDAIMAAVTGSAKPMPWDQGRPPEGPIAAGGGAAGASGPSGASGPGPGHRATLVDGAYREIIGGAYSVLTPGPVSWVTLGASTLFVNGNHRTEGIKAGMKVLGGMRETLGAQAITSTKNIARKVTGAIKSDVRGPRRVSAGGEYKMTAQAMLTLDVGGVLSIAGGSVTFKCGAAEITASKSGVYLKAPTITITGASYHTGTLTHL
jgi:type VI secretion system secreted protein VgrG